MENTELKHEPSADFNSTQSSPVTPPPPPMQLIEGPMNLSTLLTHLLKRPLDIIYTVETKQQVPWKTLLLIPLLGILVTAFVIGTFSGGHQLWAAPAKMIGGIAFAALICTPSLIIFSNLAGLQLRPQTLITLLLSILGITSILLLGFAPVIWLFSTASGSAPFFGFLCLALWIICLAFGLRLVRRCCVALGAHSSHHIAVWTTVFILVTLQMPTTLRPIIGKSDTFIKTDEKLFFLQHWMQCLSDQNRDVETIYYD